MEIIIIPLVICVFIAFVMFLTKNYLEQKQNDGIYKTYIPPTDNVMIDYTPFEYDKCRNVFHSGETNWYVSGVSFVVTGSHKLSTFDGLDNYINTAPKMEIPKDIEYGCIYCGNIYTKRIDECLGCGSKRIRRIE